MIHVPQYLFSQSKRLNTPVKIICTEPRRITAISVSERVALETGTKFGDLIGYQVRLESCTSPYTLLTFCTNGVLLRTLMGNLNVLSSITHIIVDEIHGGDKFSDFLVAVLRNALVKFTNSKLILMSATFQAIVCKNTSST